MIWEWSFLPAAFARRLRRYAATPTTFSLRTSIEGSSNWSSMTFCTSNKIFLIDRRSAKLRFLLIFCQYSNSSFSKDFSLNSSNEVWTDNFLFGRKFPGYHLPYVRIGISKSLWLKILPLILSISSDCVRIYFVLFIWEFAMRAPTLLCISLLKYIS